MAKNILFYGDPMSKQPQELMKKYLTPLADRLDLDIGFCVCHGKREVLPAEVDFDKLYIYIQMLPNEFEGVKKAETEKCKINGEEIIYPVKVDPKIPQKCPQGDSLTYTKAPAKAVMLKDEDGNILGVSYDNGIYTLNDCIHSRDPKEWEIAQKVLSYIINKALEEGSIVKYLKGGMEQKSKRCLESALKVQFVQYLDKEKVVLKAAKDTVDNYVKGIVEGERKIIATEKIIEAIQKNISDIPTALDKKWEALMKMKGGPLYTSISFNTTGIKAITSPIIIEHQKKYYEMGRYEVSLKFAGQCTIKGLDRNIDGCDHPHVTGGNVCWGNFSGYIPKLIGSSEFDVALVQIHTFLSHYDSGSPYKTIDKWPLRKSEEKTEDKNEQTLEVRI